PPWALTARNSGLRRRANQATDESSQDPSSQGLGTTMTAPRRWGAGWHAGCVGRLLRSRNRIAARCVMPFRWIALLSLWTLLIGPATPAPRGNAPSRTAQAQAKHKPVKTVYVKPR